MENDELASVDNDLQFEIPPIEVGFSNKTDRWGEIRIHLKQTVQHPATCMVDNGVWPSSVNEDYFKITMGISNKASHITKIKNDSKRADKY